MNKPTSEHFFGRWLARLAKGIHQHPRWFIWPQLLLVLVSLAYTVDSLQFTTRRDDLVGANQTYHHNFLSLKKEFPRQHDLVVVVESADVERNRQFVERLGAKVEAERVQFALVETPQEPEAHRLLQWFSHLLEFKPQPTVTVETNLFVNVFYKGDLKTLGSKALMFLTEEELGGLQESLRDYRPFINRFTQATNLVALFDLVNTSIRKAPRDTNAENKSLVRMLPALGRIVRQANAALDRPGRPPSPGVNALFNEGPEVDQQIYITFNKGHFYLLTAQPPSDGLAQQAVRRMHELIEETRLEVPGVNVGLTGESVLDGAELLQSQKDTSVATVVALVLCALIFIYGYNETGRPLKATLCLLVGLAYTMAFATFAVGHLNILTITFAPMLIGLAIDFGVHLVTRYEEELRHGRSELEALTLAMVFTGKGIFTGAVTTAAGFLAMMFTDFKGIKEMGVICGGGLLISLVPMMTLLPALLLKGQQNVLDHSLPEPTHRARIERLWLARPGVTVMVTALLCVLAFWAARSVYFDYNLLNMQSADLPAVKWEHKLIASSPKSVIFAAVVATNLAHAADLEQRITPLDSVASVDSITRFLKPSSQANLARIEDIKNDLADVQFAAPDGGAVDIPALSQSLYSLSGYLGAALKIIGTNEPALSIEFASLRETIAALRRTMIFEWERHPDACARKLAIYQRALFSDVRDMFHALQTQDTSGQLEAQDLPLALRNRFVGVSGHYLLQVYPKKNVWERTHQEYFIRQLREVDPNVTGTPVQAFEYTELLRQSYIEAAWYSLAAISLMVLIHFRSPLALVLALLPVAVGTLWMLGLMGATGIPFNPANIMTLPLVIGIGVTNGIHMLNRFAEEQTPSLLAKSTGKAVLVSGLTTIAGFGSLMLAKHQGIQSLGYVMAMGTAGCMVAGLTFLPALLFLRMKWGSAATKQPSALTQ